MITPKRPTAQPSRALIYEVIMELYPRYLNKFGPLEPGYFGALLQHRYGVSEMNKMTREQCEDFRQMLRSQLEGEDVA